MGGGTGPEVIRWSKDAAIAARRTRCARTGVPVCTHSLAVRRGAVAVTTNLGTTVTRSPRRAADRNPSRGLSRRRTAGPWTLETPDRPELQTAGPAAAARCRLDRGSDIFVCAS